MPTNIGLQNVDLSGGLGGVLAGIQHAQDSKASDLQHVFNALKARQQQLESERFGEMTPLELAIKGSEKDIKGLEGATARSMMGDVGAIRESKLAELSMNPMKAKAMRETLDSDIAAKKAGNKETVQMSEIGETLRAVMQAQAMSDANPVIGEVLFRQQLEGMPDNNLKQMLLQLNPQQRKAMLPRLQEVYSRMLTTTPKAQADITKEHIKGGYDVQVANIRAKSDAAVAQLRLNADDRRAMTDALRATAQELNYIQRDAQAKSKEIQRKLNMFLADEMDFARFASDNQLQPNTKAYDDARRKFTPKWKAELRKELEDINKPVLEVQNRLKKLTEISTIKDKEKREKALNELYGSDVIKLD